MNKISTFGSLLIFIGWFHSVAQVIIELHPVQDAVIGFHDNFNSANTNYGTADYYGAFSQPGAQGGENAAHALMKFDLSDIPPGATINSATLDIYGRGATSNTGDATSVGNVGDNQCYLERITQTWNADEVTWNTQPALTTMNAVTLPQSTNPIEDYLNIDVLELLVDMVSDPDNSYGFSVRLVAESPTRGLFFCSTNYSESTKFPTLKVSYTPCSTPTTFVFHVKQDATVGYHDNYNSANTNYGTADYFGAFSQPGASGGENAAHSLMQFDLSSLMQGTVISLATLDLFGRGATSNVGDATSVGNIGDNECYLERIIEPWDADVVTWNTKPEVTSATSVMLSQSSNSTQDYLGIDVTQLVQSMMDDPLNSFGFSIRLVTEDPTRGLFFCSTDFGDSLKHPLLTVYTCSKLSGISLPFQDQSNLLIYPNPAVNRISLTIPEKMKNKKINLSAVDMLGQVMLEMKITSSEEVSIDISLIPTGIYTIKLDDGNTRYRTTLFVNK